MVAVGAPGDAEELGVRVLERQSIALTEAAEVAPFPAAQFGLVGAAGRARGLAEYFLGPPDLGLFPGAMRDVDLRGVQGAPILEVGRAGAVAFAVEPDRCGRENDDDRHQKCGGDGEKCGQPGIASAPACQSL